MAQLNCHSCSKEHPYEESHTCIAVLQQVGPNGYRYYQCEQGGYVDGHTWQHWNCSHSCMKDALFECIEHHYTENLLHPPLSGTTNIHQQVKLAHLSCPVCHVNIGEVAYRFCVTRATPKNASEDGTLYELYGWCCSLEHAKIVAKAYIEHMVEL